MSDLLSWYNAQLDEDEWWAREASRSRDEFTPTGEHWQWEDEDTDIPVVLNPVVSRYVETPGQYAAVGLRSIEQYSASREPYTLPHLMIRGQDELETTVAGHIARHDPARVLAEVAAKRRRLARHQPVEVQARWSPADFDFPPKRRTECSTCKNAACLTYQFDVYCAPLEWPCAEIRDDLSVYADRPGYDEEWAP